MFHALTDDDLAILADVLARTDALHAPMRAWRPMRLISPNAILVAITERRRAYPAVGVPFVASGTAQERKASERQLGALASWGYLRLTGSSGRRHGVLLTEMGEDSARWICNEVRYCEAFPRVFDRMRVLRKHEICMESPKGGWIQFTEDDLCGGAYGSDWGPRATVELERCMMPLVARGLVFEHIKTTGHVLWTLPRAGIEAMESRPPAIPDFGEWEERFHPFSDRYDALLNRYLEERATWEPDRVSEVFIPGPAGAGWPEKSWRDLPKRKNANWFKSIATEEAR